MNETPKQNRGRHWQRRLLVGLAMMKQWLRCCIWKKTGAQQTRLGNGCGVTWRQKALCGGLGQEVHA